MVVLICKAELIHCVLPVTFSVKATKEGTSTIFMIAMMDMVNMPIKMMTD